jgi:hypothetical protein
MRNQAIKLIALLSLLFTLGVASTYAQSTNILVVTVPFEFSLRGKTLPAGVYIVRRIPEGTTAGLTILRKDGLASAFVLTKPNQAGDRNKVSEMVFHRYGNQYFLAQVWTSGGSIGQELFESRQERELQRNMAHNKTDRGTIAIAGRQ